ncbi:hypothetical protein ACHAQA_000949 [Verticillium albo-atrum]
MSWALLVRCSRFDVGASLNERHCRPVMVVQEGQVKSSEPILIANIDVCLEALRQATQIIILGCKGGL